MADEAINDIDVDVIEGAPKDLRENVDIRSKNTQKKKVTLSLKNLSTDEKRVRVEVLRKELEGLFGNYREVMSQKAVVQLSECGSRNAVIAALMEESELPLSLLADEIYNKLKEVGNEVAVMVELITCESLKNIVLSVGQRLTYGVSNAEADVLEDHFDSCFWC